MFDNSYKSSVQTIGLLFWFVASLYFCAIPEHGRTALWADDPPPTDGTTTGEPTPEETAPAIKTLAEMEVPPAELFLTGDVSLYRDWVILKSMQVLEVFPMSPRPRTLETRTQEYEAKIEAGRKLTGEKLQTWRAEMAVIKQFEFLDTTDPSKKFFIDLEEVEKFVHHEDLWLQRVELLLKEKNLDLAFELVTKFERTQPDWPGLKETKDKLLFADGSARLEAGELEPALMVFEEVFRSRKDFPNLGATAGRAADGIITEALAADDFRKARFFLDRLGVITTTDPVFQKHSATLSKRAIAVLDEARQLSVAGKHAEAADLADRAARIWPETPNLKGQYTPLVERYQRVRVGVDRFPGEPTAYPFATDADERHQRLTEISLFEIRDFRDGYPRMRSRFLDEWIPEDLGRTMRFTLRRTRQPWETQPVIQSWPIVKRIAERLRPEHPDYDERLASYIAGISIDSPFEFTVRFRRVPSRLETLALMTVVKAPENEVVPVPSAADSAEAPASSTVASTTVASATDEGAAVAAGTEVDGSFGESYPAGGFRRIESSDTVQVYQRVIAEPEQLRDYHVAEIQERKYLNAEAALHGLRAGEVCMLPGLPAWIIRRIESDKLMKEQYFIQKHAVPATHMVLFNPTKKVLKSRELRRALVYGLDRQGILDNILLREPAGSQGRVASGPFPHNSYAHGTGIEPRPFDPYASLALGLAARNSLGANKVIDGDLPRLRMIAPPDPVLRAAAQAMCKQWFRVGIDVELVPDDELTAFQDGKWDLLYRETHVVDPITELWPLMTMQSTARIDDLMTIPDWLKQELVDLDRTADPSRAVERVRKLHRFLWEEVAIIPLWELEEYTVYRKNIQGMSAHPVHSYDNLDNWVRSASLQATGL
ncbi:MAG: ABC transporter substrate-binding protein [Planctomycetaceae bacterium]